MVFERSHRCINLIWSVGRCSTALFPPFRCQVGKQSTATANEVLKLRSDQTDGVNVALHQQRLNGCASAIRAAACLAEKS
jgi:hypothetical protein